MQYTGAGCGIVREVALPIRPRAWLRDDGLRFRASSSRPFRTWLATSQSGSSVCLPGCRRVHVYFSAEKRGQQVSLGVSGNVGFACGGHDALQSGLSSEVPCRTSLPAIHHCWRKCWDVFDELLRWRTSSCGCGGALASHRGVPRGFQANP